MIKVVDVPVPVEMPSCQPLSLWTNDEVRPSRCSNCLHPRLDREGRLVLHAHGSYVRQVLGLLGGRAFRVWIPRFLCRICRATTSILPSWLHPWRWYSIVSIVEALCLWATERATVSQLRARYAASPEGDGWRSLSRWARDFLVRPTLLGWLGFPTSGTTTLGDRLHRFLFHVKPAGRADIREWTTEQVRWAATEALAGSEHRRVSSLTRPVTSAPGVRDALPGVDLATTFPQRKSLLAS